MQKNMLTSMVVGAIGAAGALFVFLLTPPGQQFGQYIKGTTLAVVVNNQCPTISCPDGRRVQECIVTQNKSSPELYDTAIYFRDPCGIYAGQCVFDTCPSGAKCPPPKIVECTDPTCNSGPCRAPEPSPQADQVAPSECGIDPCLGFGPSCNAPVQQVSCIDSRCNVGPCQGSGSNQSGGVLIQRNNSYTNPFQGRQLPTEPTPGVVEYPSGSTAPPSSNTMPSVTPSTSARPIPSPEQKESPPVDDSSLLIPDLSGGGTGDDPITVIFGEGWQRILATFQSLSDLIGRGLEFLSGSLFGEE